MIPPRWARRGRSPPESPCRSHEAIWEKGLESQEVKAFITVQPIES